MRKIPILAVFLSLAIAGPGNASTPGQVDNFEGGGTQDWREGSGSPNPPTNIASGGPEGVDDNYLQNSSDGGNGPGSRMMMFNDDRWQGDYIAGGVGRMQVKVANFGQTELQLRLIFSKLGTGAQGYDRWATKVFTAPADGQWRTFVLDIDETELEFIDGGRTYTELMSSVERLWLGHQPGDSDRPPAIQAIMGVDDIKALAPDEDPPLPEPEDRLIDLAALDDVDNSGAADLAVLDASLEDATAGGPNQGHHADVIHVRDGGTGAEIHQTTLSAGWQSLALESVPGNQGMLLAVLQINDIDDMRVQLKQASDGAQVRNISVFDNSWTPIDLLAVSDAGGPGVAGIGVLAENGAGQQAIEVYKTGNGALIERVLYFNNVWTASHAIDLGEFNGNGRSEMAVLATNNAGKHAIETRDALSGKQISRHFFLGPTNTMIGLADVADVDGNSRPELVVLGNKAANNNTANTIQAKDVKTGDLVAKIGTYGPDWIGFGIRSIGDVDGNSAEEVVIAVVNDVDNSTSVSVRDVAGNTLTEKVGFLGPAYDPKDVEVLDDVSGNSIQEVMVVGRRPDTGEVRVQLRDALTGTRLRNIDLP